MADKTQPQGISAPKATEEDDVEGHRFRRAASDGISAHPRADGISAPKATEEDDVEGHSLMDPFAARQLSQAREREVQQHLKRREFEQDTRAAKKDHR